MLFNCNWPLKNNMADSYFLCPAEEVGIEGMTAITVLVISYHFCSYELVLTTGHIRQTLGKNT